MISPHASGWCGDPLEVTGFHRRWHVVGCRPRGRRAPGPSAPPPVSPPRPAWEGIWGGDHGLGSPTARPGAALACPGAAAAAEEGLGLRPAWAASLRPLNRTPVTLGTQVTRAGLSPAPPRGSPAARALPASPSKRALPGGAPSAPRSRPAAPRAGLGKFAPGRRCAGRRGKQPQTGARPPPKSPAAPGAGTKAGRPLQGAGLRGNRLSAFSFPISHASERLRPSLHPSTP